MNSFLAAEDREQEHVGQLKQGCGRAYERLVRDYGPRMHAVARRFFSCPQDQDDAVQDALLSAFRSIGSFHADAALSTWLHRITVNACLMALRSRSRREAIPLDDLLPQSEAAGYDARGATPRDETFDRVVARENRQQVLACIDRLPASYRAVVLLRDIDERDTAEAARVLGTTPGNVKARLRRARQVLRSTLDRTDVQPALCAANDLRAA